MEGKIKNLEKALRKKKVQLEKELDFSKQIHALEISVIEGRNRLKLKTATNEIMRLETALEDIKTALG